MFGATVRHLAERAAEARRDADGLACQAWNARMLAFQGPAQPSPTLGDALNAGYRYLEAKCLGGETHQTVALYIVRRPKWTPVHELERYMRCKQCSRRHRHPFQTQPPCGPADQQDIHHELAISVVAGRTMKGPMKNVDDKRAKHPYAEPEAAARRLMAHARAFEPIQDGRIYIEKINGPFLFEDKGTPAEYSAGLKLAIERGWLELHESGTYVRMLQAGAELFA